VLEACHARGIVPVVTLHHFTLRSGSLTPGDSRTRDRDVARELRQRVGREFGALIGNRVHDQRADIVAVMGYLLGVFPPQVTDDGRFVAVNEMMRKAHVAMREALREGPGTYPIGMPLSMQDYETLPGGEQEMHAMRDEMEDKYLRACEGDDYLGVRATPRWS